ncbi:MAG: hypothetical protein HN623_04845 [Bdellovibrionales bacterium]|jgi:hypothetical protein|nr:hypothetical protein [Bdellovibrionales bacterium]
MSLEKFSKDNNLKQQETSSDEINNLFNIAKRDLNDAIAGKDTLSEDWQFGILYNSALKLCTILLRAQGLRASSIGHHRITVEAVPHILGPDKNRYAKYLDSCRVKRNKVEYDMVGLVSDGDVEELLEFTQNFLKEVSEWAKLKRPDLIK